MNRIRAARQALGWTQLPWDPLAAVDTTFYGDDDAKIVGDGAADIDEARYLFQSLGTQDSDLGRLVI